MSVVKIWCEGEDLLCVAVDGKMLDICDDIDYSYDYFLHFSDGTVVKFNYDEGASWPFWEVGVVKSGYATAFHEDRPAFDKAPDDFENLDEFEQAKEEWYEDYNSETCILNFPHDIDAPVLMQDENINRDSALTWLEDWFDNHAVDELTDDKVIAVFKAISGYKP